MKMCQRNPKCEVFIKLMMSLLIFIPRDFTFMMEESKLARSTQMLMINISMVIFVLRGIQKIDRKVTKYFSRIFEDNLSWISPERIREMSICQLYPSTRIISLVENVNMIANDYAALSYLKLH